MDPRDIANGGTAGPVRRTNYKEGHKRGGKSEVSYNEINIKQALTDYSEGKFIQYSQFHSMLSAK